MSNLNPHADLAEFDGTNVGPVIRRHSESLVAQIAVIDLRSRSVSRSPEPIPEEKTLELRRGFSQLNIYLPLGALKAPTTSAL